jgi:hypothetical protein
LFSVYIGLSEGIELITDEYCKRKKIFLRIFKTKEFLTKEEVFIGGSSER